jgi:hypothetical protein
MVIFTQVQQVIHQKPPIQKRSMDLVFMRMLIGMRGIGDERQLAHFDLELDEDDYTP